MAEAADLRALVVGGSIAGLSAAHVLRRLGIDTLVLERSDGTMPDRGAGLGLDLPRLRAVLGAGSGPGTAPLPPRIALQGRAVHALAPGGGLGSTRREAGLHPVTAWQHLYAALRDGLDGIVHTGAEVIAMDHRGGRWQAAMQNGEVVEADLLVGADGHRSVVRRRVDPAAQPRYAGYLLWRGMVDADAVGPAVRARFLDQHLHLLARPGHHAVVYEVPPARPGGPRRLNWGWYCAAGVVLQQALVRRAGLADDTLVVPPARLQADDRDGAVALAVATWPAPWSALVAQTAAAGGLFVNAVHEFVSLAMPDEPVVLLGDAAHLLSPITGSGAGLAMQDALLLGHGLQQALAGPAAGGRPGIGRIGQALAASRAAASQALVQSRAWAATALGVPA